MSEIGGGDDDGKEVGGSGQESGNETESASSAETSSSVEDSGTLEGTGPVEGIGARGEGSPTGPTETGGGRGIENVSVSPREITTQSHEVPHGKSQILETPASLEQTQKDVESYHQQSIEQILALNGKYMSEEDRARVAGGSDKPRAIESDPNRGRNGGYLLYKGRSSIEVSAMDQQQMERTTKHETNHFASKNREMLVPEPDKKGYTVYQTVGTRSSSWFHSDETGENYNFTTKGRGLNEGLTTLYTNQQLTELSKEKGEAAERQQIYAHATELCSQLEDIVGQDTLKEAYYGGNLQALQEKVDALAGEKGYEALQDCLDRTLSKDPAERVEAMKKAQNILAKMYEKGETKA